MANHDDDAAAADLNAGLELEPRNAWALRRRAAILLKKDDFAAAQKDVDLARTIDPGNPQDLEFDAFAAEKKSDFAAAVELYQKILQKDPKDVYALTHRGMDLVTLDRNDEALADVNAALAIDPKNTLALINRAMAELNKGDLDNAERDAKGVETLNPTIPAAYLVQGTVSQARGNLDAAVEEFSKAILTSKANHPAAPYTVALSRRASAYTALGRSDEALADTDQILAAGGSTTDVRILRANIFIGQGKRAAVAAEAEAMMRENPKDGYAFVAAGKTYAALGESDQAMKAFDKALAIHPYAYIYLNRSQIRPKADVAGRMADLDAGLKVEPDDADTLAAKARLLASSGDYKGALDVLDRVKPDPEDHFASVERAIVMYKAGRVDDASKLLASVRADSKTASQLNSLCWSKATADIMLQSAVQDCRDALRLSPGYGAYEDSLGMALLRLGKLDEALDAYDKAIARHTGAASLLGRAFVYLRKGDRARAEADAAAARKMSATVDSEFADYGLNFDDALHAADKIAAAH